jgi:UDP-glucose 4-epimerase
VLITIKELAELTIRLTNSSSKLTYLPPLKEGDMTRRQPDNQKMRNILKRDLISLEDGIKAMLKDERFLKAVQQN